MNHTNRRLWTIGIILLLIVLYLTWRWTRPAVTVQVVKPAIGTIAESVTEQAVTRLPQDYLIAMPIAGWFQGIDLREGDRVLADQVVARLDTADLTDKVAQIKQRMAVLETMIKRSADNRLENDALIQANAAVKSLDENVDAARLSAAAALAVAEFAKYELDRVKKIAKEDAAAQREVREADSAYRRAWAQYQSANFQLAGIKSIAAVSNIGPKSIRDYIDLKTFDRAQYRSQLQGTQSELDIAQRNIERATIKSPITGIVLKRFQTRRQFFAAGTPLLTLGRLDDMEVIVKVLTERATRIVPGDPVDITGEAILGPPIHGRVLRVYPEGFTEVSSLGVEQQRVNVTVKMDKRPERLGVAYRVDVRIYFHRAENTLTIPRTAAFRSPGGGWQVIVVRHGRTVLQDITLGVKNEDRAQVLSGLTNQDLVATQPGGDIQPNLRVKTVTQN